MKSLLTGLCACLLLAGLAVGCDSNRVGENPTRERTPSASPPATSPDTGSTPSTPSNPAPSSEAPKPSMPSR
jgi:hypothetical protein